MSVPQDPAGGPQPPPYQPPLVAQQPVIDPDDPYRLIDPNAQPQYAQPPQYAPPAPTWLPGEPYPPWTPAEPPRRRRWLIAVIVAVAVALTVGIVGSILWSNNDKKAFANSGITLPQSFDGYAQVGAAEANRVRSAFLQGVSAAGAPQSAFAHSAFGAYARDTGDQASLIVLAGQRSRAGSGTDQELIDELQTGLPGADLSAFPPSSHGGEQECGQETDTNTVGISVRVTLCFWVDQRTFGFAASVNQSSTATEVAATTDALVDAIEH
jgi:hypothetical protein